jgi:predicted PurR-regulated permease PerM
MHASDWLIATGTVLFVLVVGALLFALGSILKTMRSLTATLESLRTDTEELVGEMRTEVRRAGFQVDRIDSLLGAAESVEHTLDSASRLAFKTVSSPVVKAMAFGTGTKKAVQRMRNVPEPESRRRLKLRRSGN